VNPAIAMPDGLQSLPSLLDVATIYHEPTVPDYPRGR
jgi:hypothetical protein